MKSDNMFALFLFIIYFITETDDIYEIFQFKYVTFCYEGFANCWR